MHVVRDDEVDVQRARLALQAAVDHHAAEPESAFRCFASSHLRWAEEVQQVLLERPICKVAGERDADEHHDHEELALRSRLHCSRRTVGCLRGTSASAASSRARCNADLCFARASHALRTNTASVMPYADQT